jgi:hypothetical protein
VSLCSVESAAKFFLAIPSACDGCGCAGFSVIEAGRDTWVLGTELIYIKHDTLFNS